MTEPVRIDNVCLAVEQPHSLAELCELVRRAAARQQAIYPIGGRTLLDFGLPPTRPGVAVDLARLDQVIDYPARDMTITVQAGITMRKLQEVLAKEGQRLPVDVPLPDRATLGGAIACNMSGPRRYGYGTLRDYVIGITVVNDEGQETKAGGRVVKNVAGYDLCKLHVGALGTLGIVTQVTLKVLPRPEAQELVITGSTEDGLGVVLDRVRASSIRPGCVEVLYPTPRHGADFDVLIGFEGSRAALNWQVNQLQSELGSLCPPLLHQGEQSERLFHLLGERDAPSNCRLSFKANLLPSAVTDFMRASCAFPLNLVQAHAGNGIVIGHLPPDVTLEQARSSISQLRANAVEYQGNLVLLRCPTEWKRELGVWGQPRGDWQLMREIKKQLDPNNLFNPGRFVDGI